MDKEKHVYTVSEITRCMRVIVEDSFPAVWVEGRRTAVRDMFGFMLGAEEVGREDFERLAGAERHGRLAGRVAGSYARR